MSYYPTNKCFLCHGEMINALIDYFYCANEECGYEIQIGKRVILKFMIDGSYYEAWIRYQSKIYGGPTTIHKYEVDQDNIYSQDQPLELSPEEWISLIKRIEKIQTFT